MHSWSKKRERVVRLVGYVVLTFVLIGYAFSATGRHSNVVALDSLRTKEVPSNVAVIAIDDAALSALGAWPLDRSVYARLITELNGYTINGLVFDVLFLEEKADDEAVRDALSGSQYPVVLGIKRGETDFLHAVFNGEASVTEGFVNVSPDKDGKVRSFVSPERHSSGCVWPLSLAILVPTLESDVCPTINGTRFLYSREVPTFSLVDVIEGKVPKDVLKGKVLFVGATTLDLEDYFVGLEGVKIPGVFVHTAMYSSYTNNLLTKSLGATVELLAIIMFVIIGSSFVRYIKKPTKQIFFVGFVIVLLLVVTVVAFDFSYEVPLVSLVLSFLASFVLSTLFHYANSRRENAFIKNMFSRYVNKDVLQRLLESNTHHPVGEKRRISVLFSDLRGFTDFSETLLPEELTGMLNTYFARMVAEIFKQNGTVDKFIGDAVMAFWNAPLSVPDHEVHALRAAIGMQEALLRFNSEQGTSLKMGIGIHVGDAIVGNIGGEERMSYTALGDSVNTASRLEGVTKKYGAEIIISGEMKDKVGDSIKDLSWRIRKLDEVRLKGKQKSTTLFEVTKASIETIKAYEKALELYQRKSFNEALVLLRGELLRSDAPSLLLIERIESTSFPDDFNGVWVFDEK